MSSSPPPPFFFNPIGGTIPSTTNNNQFPQTVDSPPPPPPPPSSSSSQSLNPSILTLILILSLTIILSTSLCLLLRYLSSKCRRLPTHSADDPHPTGGGGGAVSLGRDHRFSSRRVSPENQSVINSLPVFTFKSVSGSSLSGGDCAVCLSKFEPEDQLRLLPICCHAFHAECVDTWLQSNQTCPLCRSPIFASESDILSKVLNSSAAANHSFRIEIGNVSRHRQDMSGSAGEARRSYSIGSFDYVVQDDSEITVTSNHARGISQSTFSDKDDSVSTVPKPASTEPPGPSLAAEVGSGRSWLRDYVDMISDRVSLSSRALSFRSSGRYFTGSSRRSGVDGTANYDVEANRVGEEISEWFRFISGV